MSIAPNEPPHALNGVRVLVTRPAHQAEHLASLLAAAGAEAIRFPVIDIQDPVDNRALLALIDRLHEFDWAIFISANAVAKAMNLIQARGAWPSSVRIACVGKGSAKELKRFGITDALMPPGRFDSEALLAMPELSAVRGRRIAIFRGDGGREWLGNSLAARGAVIEYAECYRRVKPTADTAPLLKQWARGGIDVITVTSGDGLRNLFDLVGKLGQQWLIKTPTVVVSARMAQICRELGFKHEPLIADEASDEALVRAIRAWRASQKTL